MRQKALVKLPEYQIS